MSDVSDVKHKKRGRKPKGGKIVPSHQEANDDEQVVVSNVILHLKCKASDIIEQSKGEYRPANQHVYACEYVEPPNAPPEELADGRSAIEEKIRSLNLCHMNYENVTSACFWCTCNFANAPIFIPMFIDTSNVYNVYGHFCSPECAVGYLMNERIESTTKFERYSLMHHMYLPILEYKQCIKPAPSPFHILDKYYGNMSIEEYRAMSQCEKLIIAIQKPITKVRMEVHDDSSDFIMKSRIIPYHDDSHKPVASNNLTDFLQTNVRN